MVAGKEIKTITGGMNKDIDVRFLQNGQYIDALNVRVFSTDNGADGVIENVKGNTKQDTKTNLSTYTLPSGLNKCIGAVDDETNFRNYYFVWNSEGNHVIISYDQKTQTVSEVVKDNNYTLSANSPFSATATYTAGDVIESTSGSKEYYECVVGVNMNTYGGDKRVNNRYIFEKVGNYLDFRQFDFVQARVVNKDGQSLLFWTDLVNEEGNERVRYINVDRLLGNTDDSYPTVLRKSYFDAAPDAPLFRPLVSTGAQAGVKGNNIHGKLYQIKYRYILIDGQPSAWSPYSQITTPRYNSTYTGTLDNVVNITVGRYDALTTSIVKRIEIAARECGNGNSGDWYVIKEIDVSDSFSSISTTTWGVTDGGTKYPHYYQFSWYGDETSYSLSSDEANYDYCFMPQAAKAIEFLNDNRLSLHHTVIGYAQTDVDLTLSANYSGNLPQVLEDGFLRTFKKGASYDVGIRYSDGKSRVTTVLTDDDFTIDIDYTDGSATYTRGVFIRMNLGHTPPSWAKTWQVVIRPSGNLAYEGSTPDFTQIPVARKTTLTDLDTVYGAGNYELLSYAIPTVWSYDHQDNLNLGFDSSTDNNVRQYMRLNAGNGADPTSYIDRKIGGRYTTSSENFILTNGSTSVAAVDEIIESYTAKGITNSIWYEMGEACRIGELSNGVLAHFCQNPDYTYNSDQTSVADADIEIQDGDCYIGIFELWKSPTYPVSATSGRTQSTDLANGTGYMETAWVDYAYASKSNDRGRVNTKSETYGRYTTETRSHFSQPIVQESERADFSLMYDADFVDNNNQFGSIQTVYQLNQNLYIFQENRVGYRPVARQIIEDLNSQSLVGISGKIFGEVSYIPQEYGIGNQPESLAVFGSDMFFTDVNKASVLRLRGNQMQPISDFGLKTTMDDISSYLTTFNSPIVHGEYDVEFDEYIFSIDFSLRIDASDPLDVGKRVDEYYILPDDNVLARTWSWGIYNVVTNGGGFNSDLSLYGEAYFTSTATGLFSVEEGTPTLSQEGNPAIKFIDTTDIDVSDSTNFILAGLRGAFAFSNKSNLWSTRYSYEPEYMIASGGKLSTFKDGYLYLHNNNSTYNNFYGTQYESSIKIPFNENPNQKKNYTALILDSSAAMSAEIENTSGQESSLATTDFDLREDKYNANILRDSTTPNLTYPLLDGDKLIDTNMSVNLTTDSTTLFTLFQAIARYVISRV